MHRFSVIFPLLFSPHCGKYAVRESSHTLFDDTVNMIHAQTAYFWFYFFPHHRGTGGGL